LAKKSTILYFLASGATFAWLIRDLSGLRACAASIGSCESLLQSAGPLAIVWPVYWAGSFFGRPDLAISLANMLLPLLLILFLGIFVFRMPAKKQTERRRKRAVYRPSNTEPTAWFVSPNRRNQSLDPSFD